MRSLFAAVCCACLAVAGSPARAEGNWLTDGEGVSQLLSNRSTRVLSIPDVRKLAATHEGGAWAMNSHRLVHISRDGGVRTDIDLTGGDYGEGIGLAVDPYDDSAWITTDKALLLHFSDAGTLAHGTSLPATASALFVALDQTPWLIANGQLAHFSQEAQSLQFDRAPVAKDIVAGGLAVDSLREQAWLAGSHALSHVETTRGRSTTAITTTAITTAAITTAARAIALDARTGDLWVVAEQTLIVIAHDSETRLQMDLPATLRDASVMLH